MDIKNNLERKIKFYKKMTLLELNFKILHNFKNLISDLNFFSVSTPW